MLDMFTGIVRGLQVYPEHMRKNLELTQGLVFSQRVLLALIETGLSRQDAYAIVAAQRDARVEGAHAVPRGCSTPTPTSRRASTRRSWTRSSIMGCMWRMWIRRSRGLGCERRSYMRKLALMCGAMVFAVALGCTGAASDKRDSNATPDLDGFLLLSQVPSFLNPAPEIRSLGVALSVSYAGQGDDDPTLALDQFKVPVPLNGTPGPRVIWSVPMQDEMQDDPLAAFSTELDCDGLLVPVGVTWWDGPPSPVEVRDRLDDVARQLDIDCAAFRSEGQ